MGVSGWRDRDEDMDGWTRRSWETVVLWELKQGGDYNPESAGYENLCLTTLDMGSQGKIRYAWRH